MKKFLFNILIASLALLLGVFIQNLFQFKEALVSVEKVETNKVVEIPNFQIENEQIEKDKRLDTFQDEEFGGGWYMADGFKGMREVWTILLSRDYEDSKNEKLVWSAIILTDKEKDNFESVWIKTHNNKLSFRTHKVRDIEYKFEGEFLKNGKLASEGEEVLKGTLQKLIKGKKVAEVKTNFAYHEPRCWH